MLSFEWMKIDRIKNKIQELLNSNYVDDVRLTNTKIVIFSFFKGMLDNVQKELDLNKISYCRIDGDTTTKDRISSLEEFNSNNQKKVFLCSLKACGFGLNLQKANVVMMIDPWWNSSAEKQATDRVWRIGSDHENVIIR